MKKKFTIIWEDPNAVRKTFYEADSLEQVLNQENIKNSECVPFEFEGHICCIGEEVHPANVIIL